MLSKKWLINICLAGLALFFGIKAYDGWRREVTLAPDTSSQVAAPVPDPVAVVNKQKLMASNYDLVVEKNLFAAERKEIVPAEPTPDPKKVRISKAEQRRIGRLSLLGVVMSQDRKTALIQGSKSKDDPRGVRWVVEGDEVEGMRVVDIQDEKVLLSKQDEPVEVLLYDPDKPKRRGKVKKDAEPTVMSTGDTPGQKKIVQKKSASKKKPTVTRKKTTLKPKAKAAPPRFGPPALRKKKES